MKVLAFQARRFAWQTHQRTLPDAAPDEIADEVVDAVVAFLHVEAGDLGERRQSVLRQTAKHLKWLANKRDLRTVALHSFTHLGGVPAEAEAARAFLDDLELRLLRAEYAVKRTPFGWFCAWQLDVHGESLAKVWKEI